MSFSCFLLVRGGVVATLARLMAMVTLPGDLVA